MQSFSLNVYYRSKPEMEYYDPIVTQYSRTLNVLCVAYGKVYVRCSLRKSGLTCPGDACISKYSIENTICEIKEYPTHKFSK